MIALPSNPASFLCGCGPVYSIPALIDEWSTCN